MTLYRRFEAPQSAPRLPRLDDDPGEPPGLCRRAADSVRSGNYDAAHFKLFNKAEEDEVRRIMAAEYPDIPFIVTRTF